ncbi:hypothetical protein MJG53_002783 [Ovis ammon polii x Ovis aries]|uniref:Uncharacterized protein n=2 Tax=Ovis TaxID=9935 RepID=A0A836D6U2_SHEEP|nr:hypothetical protein JEQ12_009735 [Ovis aries]KAI4588375.1 hypothetical protein MJG53_002783 [Ovis ammon polii x Ovis aries]
MEPAQHAGAAAHAVALSGDDARARGWDPGRDPGLGGERLGCHDESSPRVSSPPRDRGSEMGPTDRPTSLGWLGVSRQKENATLGSNPGLPGWGRGGVAVTPLAFRFLPPFASLPRG